MSNVQRVAVVGCGIGRAHIEDGYYKYPDRFRVVALCDLDANRLDATADELRIERRVGRFDDLLAMADIDIIDICTPPSMHFEQIASALRAGKHVICEKPLVGSLEQVDRIAEIERSSSRKLMPIFQARYGDGVQQARHLIEQSICGRPFVATAETLWRRGADYYAVPWRGRTASELGGIFLCHAIHIHDVLVYLMGPAKRVFGRVATRVNPIETEDCFSASCVLESGALVSMTGSLGSAEEMSRLRIAFEHVTMESSFDPYRFGELPWRFIPANAEAASQIDRALAGWQHVAPGFATQMRLFHEAIVTGGMPPVTVQDARRALEMATAVYHSSETDTDVTLPIETSSPCYSGW